MLEEERLQEGNNILTGRMVQKQVIRCRLHDKQNRYELSYYQEEGLLIYRCLLCNKFEYLLKYKMPKQGETDAQRSLPS